ncbi:MAG: 3-deoxy-8-phosphooctulonate synthase [Victivallaceae bacterium]|nr:3-deoxy-8-phosphooctulonate synthase [Victivallaceae bacterium]
MNNIVISENVVIGKKLTLIGGPCVVESLEMCKTIAAYLQELCAAMDVQYMFKASFDKANRSSVKSFRGPGIEEGLEILGKIRSSFALPVVTDVHEAHQAAQCAEVADVLQIPAFLCRQTDLVAACAATGKTVNIKKGQFMAPEDMRCAIEKVQDSGNDKVMLTERGTSFGYHNLVVDMRGLAIMRELGVPVVFDATHSVQLPGGLGNVSGGRREFIRPLARAAAAVGIDALFTEVHPEPEKALSDGPNSLDFAMLKTVLQEVKAIYDLTGKNQ